MSNLDHEDEQLCLDQYLTGRIYRVPDKIWGFEALHRVEHPGACIFSFEEKNSVLLCKGTGSQSHTASLIANPYYVMPDESNGLSKTTVFDLVPQRFRVKRILLLDADRALGTLSQVDLEAMQKELLRIFQHDSAKEDSP